MHGRRLRGPSPFGQRRLKQLFPGEQQRRKLQHLGLLLRQQQAAAATAATAAAAPPDTCDPRQPVAQVLGSLALLIPYSAPGPCKRAPTPATPEANATAATQLRLRLFVARQARSNSRSIKRT